MNAQQINELSTICTRYADLRNKAKTAYDSLNSLKFGLFTDTLTPDNIEILKKAMDIADSIRNNSSQRDAVKYFTDLQKETV